MNFKASIPIFVIVKDRLACLKKSVQSWIKCIEDPIQIVFIDNGSTFLKTIQFLKKSENSKIPVYWNKPDSNNFTLNFEAIIENHLNTINPRPKYYCLSDPDIMFCDDCPKDILKVYQSLLNFTSATCVSPILKINDIPDHYPLKNEVLRKNIPLFREEISSRAGPFQYLNYNGKKIKYRYSAVDTTFAMYRSSFKFKRHIINAIRVYEPYWAKHLDWYIDPNNMSEDAIYYMLSPKVNHGISHWCSTELRNTIANKKKEKTNETNIPRVVLSHRAH